MRLWPVGRLSSRMSVARAVAGVAPGPTSVLARPRDAPPPSVHGQVRHIADIVNTDIWKAQLPYISVHDSVVAASKWWEPVARAAPSRHASGAPRQICVSAPVSTAIHEDLQLRYGRVGVPLCSMGEQCAACKYPRQQGPLHIYLWPDVQARFDAGEKVEFDSFACCLLCIRRDVDGACLALGSMITNPQLQLMRSAILPPPFCNESGVPGGYLRSAMPNDCEQIFGNVLVVGESGRLRVEYDSVAKVWYFNQDAIKFRVHRPSLN